MSVPLEKGPSPSQVGRKPGGVFRTRVIAPAVLVVPNREHVSRMTFGDRPRRGQVV